MPGQQRVGRQARLGQDPQGLQWLRVALVAAVRHKGTYLAAQYARIKGRRGHKKAIVAVAHSILVIVYWLLARGESYSDLGAAYFVQRHNADAYRNRLVRQLERLGHKVTLEPADAA